PLIERSRPERGRPLWLSAAGAVVGLLVLGFGLCLILFRGDSTTAPAATPPAVQPTAATDSAPSLAGAAPVVTPIAQTLAVMPPTPSPAPTPAATPDPVTALVREGDNQFPRDLKAAAASYQQAVDRNDNSSLAHRQLGI